MDNTAAQKAINLAISGDWEEAVSLNKQIILDNPKDTDAMNRLARSYAELGKIDKAKLMLKKVVKIDPANPIATKCLEKLNNINKHITKPCQGIHGEIFIEEPGKTKLISLVNLGNPNVIAGIDPGEEVKLVTLPHKISITTEDNNYIGKLPDDFSAKLKCLLKMGNKYRIYIKSVKLTGIVVLIKLK